MGQPSINEIAESLKEWDLLTKLPKNIGEFTFIPGTGIDGQILNIAAYVHEPSHCRLDLTYTGETFDYVPVKTVGLHSFRDVRYFCRDKEKFAQMMLTHLPDILADIDRRTTHKIDYEARTLHFENWEYWRTLPATIGDYELYITPENPLPYINGSFIFLDYTDFLRGNQIYFLYNIFRDELFAEMKQNYLPLTTDAFDVLSSIPAKDKLAVLSLHMEENLQVILEKLKKD